MPICRIRISIDVAGIRAGFARERPPVKDDDWDAHAYVDDRIGAYREALRTLKERHPDLRLEVDFDAGAAAGDRIAVSTGRAPDGDLPANIAAEIAAAVRKVTDDAGGWRRHLRAPYFERHRAWRRETGSPIAH